MVMPAGAVCVAMTFFLGGGIAHVNNVDGEMQCLTGERMVAIHIHGFQANLDDGDRARTFFRVDVDDHAGAQLAGVLQVFRRNSLRHAVAALAVAFFRGDYYVQGIANLVTGQRFLQTGNDIARAVQVGHRLALARVLDDAAVVTLEGVMELNHLVFIDHAGSPRGSALSGAGEAAARGQLSRRLSKETTCRCFSRPRSASSFCTASLRTGLLRKLSMPASTMRWRCSWSTWAVRATIGVR